MNSSDIPDRTIKAFGVDGDKNTIPVESSSTTLNDGQATMSSGFPSITMIPISAGGIPPKGKDFNGILYSVSLKQQWQDSGMGYPFNAAFSTAISGYPKGAVVPNSSLTGFWLNLNDGNNSNPEVSSSALTGWVPSGDYGVTTISGLAATSVTLSTLQAAKDRILLTGTLTANINLILPAWIKKWTVVNGCSGNFTVTVKTASGSGVILPTGLTAELIGDGTNITQDTYILGYPGRLLNIQKFTANDTYQPTKGTKKVIVEVVGGGGGGGGAGFTSSSTVSIGAGGGAGGYAKSLLTTGFDGANVVVGSGGSGGNVAPSNGSNGGASSFGGVISCGGGIGGIGQSQVTPGFTVTAGVGGSANGGNIVNQSGWSGKHGVSISASNNWGGGGGDSPLGAGGFGPANNNVSPSPANGYGSGGAGGVSQNSPSAGRQGTPGMPGIVIVYEFS
jgi:hypothetical protein